MRKSRVSRPLVDRNNTLSVLRSAVNNKLISSNYNNMPCLSEEIDDDICINNTLSPSLQNLSENTDLDQKPIYEDFLKLDVPSSLETYKDNLQMDDYYDFPTNDDFIQVARDRLDEFSFLVLEKYCDTSTECLNCLQMKEEISRLIKELETSSSQLIKPKPSTGKEQRLCESALKLRTLPQESSDLSAQIRTLQLENEKIKASKQNAVKDLDDYKYFMDIEMRKLKDQILILRKQLAALGNESDAEKIDAGTCTNDLNCNAMSNLQLATFENEAAFKNAEQIDAETSTNDLNCNAMSSLEEKWHDIISFWQSQLDSRNETFNTLRSMHNTINTRLENLEKHFPSKKSAEQSVSTRQNPMNEAN